MSNIYIYSDLFLPTFPYLEIPLYRELTDRGVNVVYVLHKNDYRLTNPKLNTIFTSLNLSTISSPTEINNLMGKNDLLVSRFDYKRACSKAAEKVRASKKKVLMYDPSGIDIRVRACPAQYLTSKSEILKSATIKKFPKQYRNIFTTGTIHYDDAKKTAVDKDEFMKSYGLNVNKKLVILTPANPAEIGHQHGVNNEYTKIVRIVKQKCPNYEIMVKGHPLDYTARLKSQPGIVHKNEHYDGKHSWEQFYPDISVVKAEEGYKAIKACDAVLNVRSSIAMETPLFPKPLININRHKYTTNWVFDSGVMMDIEIDKLADVLNKNCYSVGTKACKKYCKIHCFADDGKAYVRTADAVIKILGL